MIKYNVNFLQLWSYLRNKNN